MARVRVQAEAFDVGAEFAAIMDGRIDIGGIGCFVGTVRVDATETAAARALIALELEHYPGMTQEAMQSVAAEAERRWPLLDCTLVHRFGRLLPGEAIVLVLAASRHRQAALEATAFLIDWLKTSAPFWKKEVFADGEQAWVPAREQDEAAAQAWVRRP